MTDLNEWLKDRRTIYDAATEGPWAQDDEDGVRGLDVYTDAHGDEFQDRWDRQDAGIRTQSADDAAFIVDAHNTLPHLVSAIQSVLGVAVNLGREARGRKDQQADELRLVAGRINGAVQTAIEGASNEHAQAVGTHAPAARHEARSRRRRPEEQAARNTTQTSRRGRLRAGRREALLLEGSRGSTMTSSDYINRAFRPQPGRKYFNHMAEHTRGGWHRHMLLSSGQYIKTSDPDAYRFQIIGEAGPELISFRPHHKGTAIGMGDDHWPGCGCD